MKKGPNRLSATELGDETGALDLEELGERKDLKLSTALALPFSLSGLAREYLLKLRAGLTG